MATRTIANAGGVWTTAGTWVENQVPTAADDVVATATSGNLTVSSSGAVCRSADFTNYTGLLSFTSTRTVSVGDATAGAGNVALKYVSGMSVSYAGTSNGWIFVSSSATQQTIDFAGKGVSLLTFNGSGSSYLINGTAPVAAQAGAFTVTQGTVLANVALPLTGAWTLTAGSLTLAASGNTGTTFTHTAGTFDMTGVTTTFSGGFTSNNSNVRTITITNGTLSCAAWTLTTSTNLTLNTSGSTLNTSGAFAGGSKTYNIVGLAGAVSVTGTNSVTTLNITSTSGTVNNFTTPTTVNVTGSGTTISGLTGTITNFNVTGTGSSNILSSMTITTLTISTTGTVTLNSLTVTTCTATNTSGLSLGTANSITTLNANFPKPSTQIQTYYLACNAGVQQNIGTLTTTATMATGPLSISSNSPGVTATISIANNSTTNNVVMRDIAKQGGGTWTITGGRNVSNNSGMVWSSPASPKLIATTSGTSTDNIFAVCDTTMLVDSESATTTIGTSPTTTGNSIIGAITVDGIALKLQSRVASPIGTFSVSLRNTTTSTDARTTTVNVSDLNANGGWHFFKFSESILTTAAQNYAVKVVCSVASEVVLYRSATTDDLSRLLRTTTLGPIVIDSQIFVMSELTGQGTNNTISITHNQYWQTIIGIASTDSLIIGSGGTWTFGVSASTSYGLTIIGNIIISGGTWNQGTSEARLPSSSSSTIIFLGSLSGGFIAKHGTVNIYGNNITSKKTFLTANASAAATSLTVGDTTGWASGDLIAIASTSQTYSECEQRTINTVPTGTTLTVTAGLTYAHSGTSPTQAEVIHLSRNIKIRGESSSNQGWVCFESLAVVNLDSVEFYFMGSNNANKVGIDIQTTTGSFAMTGCVYRDSYSPGNRLYISGANSNNINISYCNFNMIYSSSVGTFIVDSTTGNSIVIDNCTIIGYYAAQNVGYIIKDIGITFTNNTVIGCYGVASPGLYAGIIIGEAATMTGTFSGLVSHSNLCNGIEIYPAIQTGSIGITSSWRNASGSGIYISSSSYGILFSGTNGNGLIFGNNTGGVGGIYLVDGVYPTELTFRGFTIAPDTTYANTTAVYLGSSYGKIYLESCTIGVPSGIYTTHTTADIPASINAMPVFWILRNTTLGSPTEISNLSSMFSTACYIISQKHDQTAGLHKRWEKNGVVSTNSSVYRTASPSLAMTPSSTSIKLTATRHPYHLSAPVANGTTLTFTCYVYKSAVYNGSQPRLIVLANPAVGVMADTVLATASGGTESWLTLSGTTITATDDGVMNFTIDCDGTAGIVYVDDCFVSGSSLDTSGLKYWYDGQPYVSGPVPISAGNGVTKLAGFGGGLIG